MQTFYQWLQKQIERDDIVGSFASAVGNIEEPQPSTRKRISPHMVWSSWLVEQNPTWEVINAFNIAWKEYQQDTVPQKN